MRWLMILLVVVLIVGCDKPETSTPEIATSEFTVTLLDADGDPVLEGEPNKALTLRLWDMQEQIIGKDVINATATFYAEPGEYLLFTEKTGENFRSEELSGLADGVQFKKITVPEKDSYTIQYNDKIYYEDEFLDPNLVVKLRDGDGNAFAYENVYIGSMQMYERAVESGWKSDPSARFRTDADGEVKLPFQDDTYVIGLDRINPKYLKDHAEIPADGKYVVKELSGETEVVIGDVNAILDARKDKAEDEREAELAEEREKEKEREEYCDPTGPYAVTRCCAEDFYLVEGDNSDPIYGYDVEVSSGYTNEGEMHVIIVDGQRIGNRTRGVLTHGSLFMEPVGCGHPEGGWPECCMKIRSLGENQQAFGLGDTYDEITLKDTDTAIYEDTEQDVSAFVANGRVYFKNRTITDYRDEEEIGIILESTELNGHFMKPGDSVDWANHTVRLLDMDPTFSVAFNGTTETGTDEVNGLYLDVQTFTDALVVQIN